MGYEARARNATGKTCKKRDAFSGYFELSDAGLLNFAVIAGKVLLEGTCAFARIIVRVLHDISPPSFVARRHSSAETLR
jgi:hypothetical protein